MSVSTFLQTVDEAVKGSPELFDFTRGVLLILVITLCFFKHENTMSKMLDTVQRSNEVLAGSNTNLKYSNGLLSNEVATYKYE